MQGVRHAGERGIEAAPRGADCRRAVDVGGRARAIAAIGREGDAVAAEADAHRRARTPGSSSRSRPRFYPTRPRFDIPKNALLSSALPRPHRLHECRSSPARAHRHRCADRALPPWRSGGVGADRPAALAQGLQRRLQVRRLARAGRGPDAGHLPQDLQVARHLRPPGEFPDVADQRQPEPVHRSLPQRAQGAADDRPRGDGRGRLAGLGDHQPAGGPRAPRPRGAAAPGAAGPAAVAAHGRPAARHPGTVLPGDRGAAAPPGGNGQVADQPRAQGTGPPDPAASRRSQRAGSEHPPQCGRRAPGRAHALRSRRRGTGVSE